MYTLKTYIFNWIRAYIEISLHSESARYVDWTAVQFNCCHNVRQCQQQWNRQTGKRSLITTTFVVVLTRSPFTILMCNGALMLSSSVTQRERGWLKKKNEKKKSVIYLIFFRSVPSVTVPSCHLDWCLGYSP